MSCEEENSLFTNLIYFWNQEGRSGRPAGEDSIGILAPMVRMDRRTDRTAHVRLFIVGVAL